MKKIFSFIFVLISLFTLMSCGGEISGPKPGNNGNNEDDNNQTITPDNRITYTVKLYRDNTLWYPNMDIYAIFTNETSTASVLIDGFSGIAEFKGNGEYNVHLSATPNNYIYNPNTNVVDPQHPDLIIDLYRRSEYTSGSGLDPYANAYCFSKTGYYSVTLNSANDIRYFQFWPAIPGKYSIESICDVYDDSIDPTAIRYNGTDTYINPDAATTFTDGGVSLEAGYTRNFKFTLTSADVEMNTGRPFSVSAESKLDEYPVTVNFKVTYEDTYSLGPGFSPTVIYPEEELSYARLSPNASGKKFNYCIDLNGGVLDQDFYRYYSIEDGGDGFYHVYDLEKYPTTNGFGPTLCVQLNNGIPKGNGQYLFDGSFYEIAAGLVEGGGSWSYLFVTTKDGESLCYNYMLYGTGPLNSYYPNFTYNADYYARYMNNDGFVYVTKEMMEFLQLFANQRSLFRDGNGYLEIQTNSKGEWINSGQEDQWLFACGYYE